MFHCLTATDKVGSSHAEAVRMSVYIRSIIGKPKPLQVILLVQLPDSASSSYKEARATYPEI